MNSEARVFGEGTLTIVIGHGGSSWDTHIYIGTHKISMAKAFKCAIDASEDTLEGTITLFPPTGDMNVDLKVEEQARLLVLLKWLKVQR